jgi:hypothetical protein
MSNFTDFQEKLNEIMAIPDQEVQSNISFGMTRSD